MKTAAEYFQDEMDVVGFNQACRNFGIGTSTGDDVLNRNVTSLVERKILAVIANRGAGKTNTKYKGTRHLRDAGKFMDTMPAHMKGAF